MLCFSAAAARMPMVSRTVLPRASVQASRSMMTIGDKLMSKERVEEDRYMKAQEAAWKEKLRLLKAQETDDHEKELYDQVLNPVMKDVEDMLKETGDSISKEGLEKLAKWKIDV